MINLYSSYIAQMKIIKFITTTSLIVLTVACGGDEKKAEDLKMQNPEALSLPHFEKQTDANCAIHAINVTLGKLLITPDEYERYMNLIAIKSNPRVSGQQRRLMRKYYASKAPNEPPYTRGMLAADWNQVRHNHDISYEKYLHQTGIFGRQKNIGNVIRAVNELYSLNISNEFNIESNPNFENSELIIIDIDKALVVLRRDNYNKQRLLNALSQDPKDHVNWLHSTIARHYPNIAIFNFTLKDIYNIENSIKKTPKSFSDSIFESDLFGIDFIEDFFSTPSLTKSKIEKIIEDLDSEKPAFQDGTYTFLLDFIATLYRIIEQRTIKYLIDEFGMDASIIELSGIKIPETIEKMIDKQVKIKREEVPEIFEGDFIRYNPNFIRAKNNKFLLKEHYDSRHNDSYEEKANPETILAFRQAAAKFAAPRKNWPYP
ncbi:hypothetical protein [Mycoavidus sp. B2-EB]|uniref:hypothetical protein n=1 Tax=Mycoavidus sp. B2-EB TaxID=2651972 RepID=UPI0016241BD0|nr:hypothetical protein [Mycoavidus sp. B2-EB]BBO59269.1 hypothetical protein MPB2EB_0381 [Mycoavidus sp. B2-EB]